MTVFIQNGSHGLPLTDKLKDWNVLQDDAYLGGHTVASDGELYVFDNTDMNQVLVYTKM